MVHIELLWCTNKAGSKLKSSYLRDWSLITGGGGATKREGGMKLYPYEKWGHTKF